MGALGLIVETAPLRNAFAGIYGVAQIFGRRTLIPPPQDLINKAT